MSLAGILIPYCCAIDNITCLCCSSLSKLINYYSLTWFCNIDQLLDGQVYSSVHLGRHIAIPSSLSLFLPSFIHSLIILPIHPFSHSVSQSVSKSITESVSQPVAESVSQSVSQSLRQSVTESVSH